ncbi:MAG TPA: cytochrome c peroxidase [Vineibacter sp.]|nr:cytochrome c peroxidase [Vineibacter sp.]
MAPCIVAALAATPAAALDEAALLKQAQEIFKPLPADMALPGVPLAAPRIALGRMLFFDPRLTVDANMSCATCHQPALYGTDGLTTSIGVRHRPHPRHAPTVLNSALGITHWRGDRESVEDQVIKALTSPITFGQPDEKAVLDRLAAIPGYAPLFKAAFPDEPDPVSALNIASAIGAYERTLMTPAPFDAYLTGDIQALGPSARAGLDTFISTGCVACHNGVGVGGSQYRKFGMLEDYWMATNSRIVDKGRIEVTKDSDDLYVFRVPSLRNVARTPPYFHDGSVFSLRDAVRIMARIQLGVELAETDVSDIVVFLESLTGELPATFSTVPALPSGAVAPEK